MIPGSKAKEKGEEPAQGAMTSKLPSGERELGPAGDHDHDYRPGFRVVPLAHEESGVFTLCIRFPGFPTKYH